MSRALFVTLDEPEVIARCSAAKVGISAVERLPAGGVRFVCMSSEGAASMARKLKSHLIKGPVKRQRHRPPSPLW